MLTGTGTIAIPNTVGGSITLKTITLQNNEIYPVVAMLTGNGLLRTETVNPGRRCQMEGMFSITVNSGTLLGVTEEYVEIHLQGTGGAVSGVQGFPANKEFIVSGNLLAWAVIAPGASSTFDFKYTTSQAAQNFHTANGLGYVRLVGASMMLYQARKDGLDVAII